MNHHSKTRKFGREEGPRDALMKSLALALITHEKIETTHAKAKSLRPYVEHLVTKAKMNTLAARRHIVSKTGSEVGAKTLVETIAPKYTTRQGGYTRIIKLPRREADGSAMAVIEFV